MNKIIEYSKFLDKNNVVELKMMFVIDKETKGIIDFVLILFLVEENVKKQIIKYDYSQKEKLNVHKYYLKIEKKEFINSELDVEKIFYLKNEIIKNWGKYILLFKQKEYI